MHAPAAPRHHQAQAADQCGGGWARNGGGRGPPSNSTGTTKRIAQDRPTCGGPQRLVRLATRHSPLATAHANSDRAALPSSSHTTHGPFGFRFQVSRASAQRRCVVVGRSRSCVLTDKPILLRNHCLRATGISKRFPFISAAMTISRHQSDADQVIPRTNNLFRLSWVLLIQLRSTARALLAVRSGAKAKSQSEIHWTGRKGLSIHLRFALIYLTSSPSSISRGFRPPRAAHGVMRQHVRPCPSVPDSGKASYPDPNRSSCR